MKGLMFNLLESLATDAGCSEEAWELVAEFAATDLTPNGSETRERLWGSDVHPPHVFDVPAEAMLTCLTRDGRAGAGPNLYDLCTSREWLRADLVSEVSQGLSDCPAITGSPGFGPSAFSSRTRDQLLELADPEGEQEWDEDQLHYGRGYREGRGR